MAVVHNDAAPQSSTVCLEMIFNQPIKIFLRTQIKGFKIKIPIKFLFHQSNPAGLKLKDFNQIKDFPIKFFKFQSKVFNSNQNM